MKEIKLGLSEKSYQLLLERMKEDDYKDLRQWICHKLHDLTRYNYDPKKCQAKTDLGNQCQHPIALNGLCMKHYKQTLNDKK